MNDAIFSQRQQQLYLWFAQRHRPQLDLQEMLLTSADEYVSTGYELRASAYLALALAQSGDTSMAWAILDRVLQWQDCRRSSLTYGNYFWRSIWKEDPGFVRDPNAASFIVPPLTLLLRRGDMPDELSTRVRDSLALAGEALLAHRATWGYTNIALLNIAGKLLIGSVLDDDRQRRLAYWDWEEWRNHTAKIGLITETFSNCYTWVQLEALALMLTCPDADAGFTNEVRRTLRHLLTACLQDFHPGIGRITGTQSRAYLHDRRSRRGSAMDNVLYLLWGEKHIDPAIASHLWMGAAIDVQDVLPGGRNLTLPRVTRAVAPGYVRTNYLAEHFTLGVTHCTNPLIGVAVPLAVGYVGRSNHCMISLMPSPKPAQHAAMHERGDALAAWVWLNQSGKEQAHEPLEIGVFSGLKTGRPTAVQPGRSFQPTCKMDLGPAEHVTLLDEQGRPVTVGPIPGSGLAIQYDHVRLFWRFLAGPGSSPALKLQTDDTGQLQWVVTCPPADQPAEPGIDLTLLGAWVAAEPVTAQETFSAFTARMAARSCTMQNTGSLLKLALAAAQGHAALALEVHASPAIFYGTADEPVSPERWGLSLQQANA